jgi:hypothetical protein
MVSFKLSFISIMLSFLVLHTSCYICFLSLRHLGIMVFSMSNITINIIVISNFEISLAYVLDHDIS